MREDIIDIGRVKLNVARFAANGPPLVMWHGLVRRWQDFDSLFPALTPHYSVTAVDHRGHGDSGRTPGEYGVTDYASDCVAFVRAVIREPAILYGHSLGAFTALAAAAECPDLVHALVMEDPPSAKMLANLNGTNYAVTWERMRELAGNPDLQSTFEALGLIRLVDGRTLSEVRSEVDLQFLASCIAELDPETLTAPLNGSWMDSFDPIATARRVRCPVLLLASDPALGGMLPSRDADALTEALADCSRVDFPGRGHLLHGEHPEAVLKVLLPFLESLR